MPRTVRALTPIVILALWISEAGAHVVLSPTHYDLDVNVDYGTETLQATARVDVENPSTQPVRRASLLLYRLLHVQSVRDRRGKPLAFTQTVVAFEDFGKLQVNQVLVTLPKPLAPGARTELDIRYDGYVVGYAETGMRYIQDHIAPEFTILRDDSYAYPRPGYPSFAVNRDAPEWSFTYNARITVPESLTVANGGRLEARDVHGGRVTFRFSSLKPSWRMDFAIAKYGEMTSSHVRVYYLPGDSLGAAGVAQAARKAMDLFSRWFGPRRETTPLTFIEIPNGWGSQTDVTTIIQSAAAFQDPKRHHEVYHEVSHLWNVPSTDRPSPRWNEGLASFLEYLVVQKVSGKPVVDSRANELLNWLRAKLPDHPRWKAVPLVDYGRADMTDLSYSVGALFFDLLYRVVGQETFNKIIGRYVREFEDGGNTDDLVKVARDASSADVSPLVHDWIYTTAWTQRIDQDTDIQGLAAYYRRAEGQRRK